MKQTPKSQCLFSKLEISRFQEFAKIPMHRDILTRFYWKLSTWGNPGNVEKYYMDTGNCSNFIRKNIALRVGVTKIDTHIKNCIIMNGTEVKPLGSVWLHLAMENMNIPTRFYVLDDLEVPAKIGYKFMNEHVESIEQNFGETIFKLKRNADGKLNKHGIVSEDLADYLNCMKNGAHIETVIKLNSLYDYLFNNKKNNVNIETAETQGNNENREEKNVLHPETIIPNFVGQETDSLDKCKQGELEDQKLVENVDKPETPIWNPYMDGLEDIDFRADVEYDLYSHYLYTDFKEAVGENQIDYDSVKFTNRMLHNHEVDATFLIVNSKSAYKELKSFVHLPYGLTEYLEGRIFSFPNQKLWGIVMNGTKRSIIDTDELFEGLVDGFHNSPEFVASAKTVQIISFKNVLDVLELNMLRYVAQTFKKLFIILASEKDSYGAYIYNTELANVNDDMGLVFLSNSSHNPVTSSNNTVDNPTESPVNCCYPTRSVCNQNTQTVSEDKFSSERKSNFQKETKKDIIYRNQGTQTDNLFIEQIENSYNHKGVKHPIEFTCDYRFYLELSTTENAEKSTSYLLDTGAQMNIVTAKRAKEIGAVYIDTMDVAGIRGIEDSKTLCTLGSIWVRLKIGEHVIPTKFYVINNLPVPAILGAEFIKTHIETIGDNFGYGIFKANAQPKKKYLEDNYVGWDFVRHDSETYNQHKKIEDFIDNNTPSDGGLIQEKKTNTEKNETYKANTPLHEHHVGKNRDIGKIFVMDEYYEEQDEDQDPSMLEYRKLIELNGNDRVETIINTVNLNHLNNENFSAIEAIMEQYSDVFYLKGDKLTITDAAIHEIETTTNVPINKRQYRFPESTKRQINEEIDEMHRQGIIKHSKSPWNAPVLCIPKKDLDEKGNKKYRIVVDFRALNLITKPFVYPIPRINEIFDDLGNNTYFSTLDLKSGFYQVPIHPRDAAKTAFSTPKGHFEFTRMPMGLRNSPSTFQRLMNTVLYELGDIKAIVYLDDIIVFGRTIEEHNRNLCRVLEAMRRHNLKIEPTKCQILRTELKYLGHTINKDGISPTDENIKAIREMAVPTTVKGVRSFLGTVNFYGKFIPKIAEIRKPLNDLLKKNAKFIWNNECQLAFESLKNFLTSDLLLVRPNYEDTFVLTTDASEYAIGAVLSNVHSINKPIAFASRGLVGAERRYHTIEKELLAIVWAVEYFRHYIYGQNFIVYTDHRPLISIWHLKETSPTLTRLRLKLQGLDCDIRYKQGKENVVADFLSRLHSDEIGNVEQPKSVMAITRQQTRRQQLIIDNNDDAGDLDVDLNTSKIFDDPELTNIDISDNDDPSHELDNTSYEDFKKALNNAEIDDSKLIISKNIKDEKQCDARFVILNSKSAFNEFASLYDCPHGIKDFIKEESLIYPERKVMGMILGGKSNSLIECKSFFESIMAQFDNCPDFITKACNIHMISFRKIRQYEIINVIKYIAWKLDKEIILYNADAERINVSKNEIETILYEFHDAPLGGHVGAKRMHKKIALLYEWPNMRRDIENYVKQCDACQRNKIWSQNKIPMKITTTSSEPFEKVYMDIVVLPESDFGNRYGLVMQDDLTRFLIIAPMDNQESDTVAKTFVENYICKFGTPLQLVTDQGSNFMSEVFKQICKILKIKKINTSAYHPQANLVERSNREFKTYLRQYVAGNPRVWDQHLPYFMFEYNTTENSSTKYSPFELLYGRAARIPTSIYKIKDERLSYDDYITELKSIFKNLHDKTKDNLLKSKEVRKQYYDKKAKEWQPMWGDLVLVHANPTGAGQKLQSYWRGPYEVIDLPSEQTTIIKNGSKFEQVHNNRLRKYYD